MRSLICSTLLILCATQAIADVSRWKTVGEWDISFYGRQEGCLAYTKYQRGTQFYLGFDSTYPSIHLDVTLIDARWSSLEEGRTYPVSVTFGDEVPWSLDMTAQRFGRLPGILLNFSAGSDQARRFMQEFMHEAKMVWRYEGKILGDYSLRGSSTALEEVVACQRSFEEAAKGLGEAFPREDNDPFAN